MYCCTAAAVISLHFSLLAAFSVLVSSSSAFLHPTSVYESFEKYIEGENICLLNCYRDDLDLIQGEINQISEQYSIKVLECATMEERLEVQTKALHQSRKRVQDLIAR